MQKLGIFVLLAIAAMCLAVGAPSANAQVSINVQIGPQPVCPYGYFDYSPFNCAPFGYYGPQWFRNGAFIGAGPWFNGPDGFRGYVDRYYNPQFGYRGPLPRRGERPDWGRHLGWEKHFHGNYMREEYRHDNGNHYGQYKDHGNNGNHYGQYKDHGNPHDHRHGKDHGNRNDNGHGHGH